MMDNRYISLQRHTQVMGCQDTPVLVEAWALLLDSEDGKYLAQAKYQSVSVNLIRSMTVKVYMVDANDAVISEVEHVYENLLVEQGQRFGQQEPIDLPDLPVKKIFVSVENVVFIDESQWQRGDRVWSPLSNTEKMAISSRKAESPKEYLQSFVGWQGGLIVGLFVLTIISALLVSNHLNPNRRQTFYDGYEDEYDSDEYEYESSSSSTSYDDETLKALAAIAIVQEIRNKIGSGYTDWSDKINPGNCRITVSTYDREGDGYKVYGNGYFYDDYGNLTEKYRDGSGGWTFNFEVEIDSDGDTRCRLF